MTNALQATKQATVALADDFDEQLQALKDQVAPDANEQELQLFSQVCKRTGLDPFAKQIYAIHRYNKSAKRKVMTIQVSIDGARLIAERNPHYAGQLGPYWCGPDGKWVDVWLKKEPPVAAKVGVLRSNWKEPLYSIAKFESYAQRFDNGNLMGVWATMPDHMIAKCAESLALRRAFPQELSGVFTTEEMGQAGNTALPQQSDHTELVEGEVVEDEETGELASEKQVKFIHALMGELDFSDEDRDTFKNSYGIESFTEVTKHVASTMIEELIKLRDEAEDEEDGVPGADSDLLKAIRAFNALTGQNLAPGEKFLRNQSLMESKRRIYSQLQKALVTAIGHQVSHDALDGLKADWHDLSVNDVEVWNEKIEKAYTRRQKFLNERQEAHA